MSSFARSNTTDIVLKRTEGYLHKKGGAVNKGSLGGRRNWKKRWFVLETTTLRGGRETYELKYYENQKGKLKGTVQLQGTEIFCERNSQHNNKSVKYEFQILLQNGSMLNLSSDSFKERDEWIESMNYAITSMRSAVEKEKTMAIIAGYDPQNEHKEEVYTIGQDIAQSCQAYGSGLFGAEAGQQAEFIIQLYGPDGQALETGGFPFTAYLVDDECQYHIGVHDNENGSFSSFYVISRPGDYKLHILLNDEHHICGSPFSVEVMPSQTEAAMSVASGDTLRQITPDVISEFTVTAMDSFGNRKRRGGDPFELGVMGPAKLHGLQDNGDGTYTCRIEAHNPALQTTLTAASLSVMVTLHGKHIMGSPFRPAIDMEAVNRAIQELNQQRTAKQSVNFQSDARGGGRYDDSSDRKDATSGNKLEQARQRALYASQEQQQQRDRDATPQELVARAMDENRDLGHSGSSRGAGYHQSPLSAGHRGEAPPPRLREASRGGFVSSGGGPGSSPPAAPPPTDSTKMKQRLSKLDKMTQKLGSSRSHHTQESSGGYNSLPPPNPSELMDALEMGLITAPPDDLPNEYRRLWGVAHEALRSREIVNLIATNVVALQSSFVIAAETPTARLAFYSASERGAGLARLFEEFDVIPAYLSKKELKSIAQLVLASQARSGAPVAAYMNSKGVEGIDFTFFLKLLVMVSIFCLSKTQAFSSLYPTIKAKVDVMLFKWGFADPLKIRTIHDRIRP